MKYHEFLQSIQQLFKEGLPASATLEAIYELLLHHKNSFTDLHTSVLLWNIATLQHKTNLSTLEFKQCELLFKQALSIFESTIPTSRFTFCAKALHAMQKIDYLDERIFNLILNHCIGKLMRRDGITHQEQETILKDISLILFVMARFDKTHHIAFTQMLRYFQEHITQACALDCAYALSAAQDSEWKDDTVTLRIIDYLIANLRHAEVYEYSVMANTIFKKNLKYLHVIEEILKSFCKKLSHASDQSCADMLTIMVRCTIHDKNTFNKILDQFYRLLTTSKVSGFSCILVLNAMAHRGHGAKHIFEAILHYLLQPAILQNATPRICASAMNSMVSYILLNTEIFDALLAQFKHLLHSASAQHCANTINAILHFGHINDQAIIENIIAHFISKPSALRDDADMIWALVHLVAGGKTKTAPPQIILDKLKAGIQNAEIADPVVSNQLATLKAIVEIDFATSTSDPLLPTVWHDALLDFFKNIPREKLKTVQHECKSFSEIAFIEILKAAFPGQHFVTGNKISLYSFDACLPEQKIAIEFNGACHYDATHQLCIIDQIRGKILAKKGWQIIYISKQEWEALAPNEQKQYLHQLLDGKIQTKKTLKISNDNKDNSLKNAWNGKLPLFLKPAPTTKTTNAWTAKPPSFLSSQPTTDSPKVWTGSVPAFLSSMKP